MNKLAEFISTLLHPLIFVLVLPFFIIYRQTESGIYALKWTIFTSGFIFCGLLFYFYGRLKGFYSDHDLSVKEQRHSFYLMALVACTFYFLAAVFFKGIFFPLSIIAFGVMMGILVFEIVNYYVKASVHIAVMCAWVTAVTLIYGIIPFFGFVWIVPVVAWARLRLKRHTPIELIIGGILGIGVTIFTYILGKELFYG